MIKLAALPRRVDFSGQRRRLYETSQVGVTFWIKSDGSMARSWLSEQRTAELRRNEIAALSLYE
jgi:hypothetical protein